MARSRSVKAKTEVDPQTKVPRRIYDINEPESEGQPREIAEQFLARIAGDLKIKPDLSELRFDEVRPSILGNHVLFQQQHDGLPISGAWVRVDVDPKGKVYNVQNDLVPEPAVKKSAQSGAMAPPVISEEQAKTRALAATGSTSAGPHTVYSSEEVAYPVDGVPRRAWKVVVVGQAVPGEWKVYIDANDGSVLGIVKLLKDAHGRVFDPNPCVVLNDTTLHDTSVIVDAAYSVVELKGLDGSGHLDGPFVSTSITPSRVTRADGEFLFDRSQQGFKEVMVYFHLDRVQRYIQDLGFTNVLNKPIKVNVVGRTDDNSDYSPVTKALEFGTGGVDDAEDAEVVLHEYGHAIQDNQVPGFGATSEGGAMGEGFGDYLAASFFADRKPARLQDCIASWDATSYSGDNPPSLRRLDSNKKYPRDMVHEVHADGEIWSACLWQIRKALGGRTADKLVIAHHSLLTPHSGFEDAANALITTDGQLNGGRNVATITDVFVRRGILPNPRRNNKRAGVPFEEIYRGGRPKGGRQSPARSAGRSAAVRSAATTPPKAGARR